MTVDTTLPPLVQAMMAPGFYPHRPERVELRQTHISYVFLAGDLVLKVKKPVDFGFLDFTTRDKREQCCRKEVELNRRLCPDIYLGVSAVTEKDGGFSLDGDGGVVEYAVRMKRMDEGRIMSTLLQQGLVGRADIGRIVQVLVPFYEKAAAGPDLATFGTPEAVAVNVLENFDQTRSFIGAAGLDRDRFSLLESYARGFLSHAGLFQQRREERKIRDCHGDMYSANICLDQPVHIFDCIEFNDRFRYADVASDVAFLAMDLDFHGRMDLSAFFIEEFVKASGDRGLTDMLDFYKCYRACVRGKIGLFTANAPEVDGKTKKAALDGVARYFALAESYAQGKQAACPA